MQITREMIDELKSRPLDEKLSIGEVVKYQHQIIDALVDMVANQSSILEVHQARIERLEKLVPDTPNLFV